MITYIVPTRDIKRTRPLIASLVKLNKEFEVLPVEGAKSMFDAWRQALPKVKSEWVVLTHDDVVFHHIPEFSGFDLGGVAGASKYDTDDTWWFSKERLDRLELSGRIYHHGEESEGLSVFGPYGDCKILDGVCLVARTRKLIDILKDIPIDCGWDWYDHILSTAYVNEGLRVKTIPILMTHASAGGNKRQDFFDSMKTYVEWYKTNNTSKTA